MGRYGVTAAQWVRIAHLLSGKEGDVGVTANDNRLFVDAVMYRDGAGIPWRDLPEGFGDPTNVHRRFSRWAKTRDWERVLPIWPPMQNNEYAMIDSTIVRAHQHSAGAKKVAEDQAIGRFRGGLNTKIHSPVDALGNTTAFCLTGGQAHDLEGADELLPGMAADFLIADKVFDADERVIDLLAAQKKTVVISPKAKRKVSRDYDREIYKSNAPDRELLRQTQALSRNCNTLRQDCQKLSRRRPYHLFRNLTQLTTVLD